MRPLVIAFVPLLFIFQNVVAQMPLSDHAWIGTGRVSAKINSNGALVTEFLVPNEGGDGDSLISTVKEISIWMGGLDPAGNLYLAIQKSNAFQSNFQGGFRGIPNSAGVWKVTKEEIEQHIQDFEEDGDIDVEIPSIFSWPGFGSKFSKQANGFALDSLLFNIYVTGAPYFDRNSDGKYTPDLGDFPVTDYVAYNFDPVPNEITFAPFHTKTTALMKMDCNSVFFAYDCDSTSFLEDAIFGYVTILNTGFDRLDSLFLAFSINSDIGQSSDDYIGSLYNCVYFYNADSIDSPGFGNNPPLFGFYSFGNLLDTFGSYTWVHSIMPIYSTNEGFPLGMTAPQIPYEYYNYITGSWRDGSPLKFGGNGYQSNGQPVSYIFSGNPSLPGEWSEISENNPPGNRRALLSNGPTIMKPNSSNRLLFALENVSGNNIGQQIDTLKSYLIAQAETTFDSIACLNTTSAKQPSAIAGSIFPNPSSTHFTLRTEEIGLQQVVLFDMLGRTVANRQSISAGSQEIALSVMDLPPGVYFLQWTMRDGRKGSGKILVTK
jgi:hypothetical protein